MIIKQNYLEVNPFSRPGRFLLDVKAIVIHWVGKSRQTSEAVQKYFNSLAYQSLHDVLPDVYASAHYAIDNSNIVQMLPENEVGYHVGGWGYTNYAVKMFGAQATSNKNEEGSTPNWYTIGIELNHKDDEGRFTEQTYYTAVDLTAMLCKKYDLDPFIDVVRHYDITGKLCPKWYVLHQMDWDLFLGDVAEKIDGGEDAFTSRDIG